LLKYAKQAHHSEKSVKTMYLSRIHLQDRQSLHLTTYLGAYCDAYPLVWSSEGRTPHIFSNIWYCKNS